MAAINRVTDNHREQIEALMASCHGPATGQPELLEVIDGTTWAITAEEAWTLGTGSTLITADRTDGGF